MLFSKNRYGVDFMKHTCLHCWPQHYLLSLTAYGGSQPDAPTLEPAG